VILDYKIKNMGKRLIINEEEKSEILKKHTDFKKVLQEELSNFNRGLVSEQFNTGVVNDPLLTAAEKAKCISNGKQINWEGKPGYYKVATADREGRFSIGDKLVIYNDYTYEVYPKDGSKRKKFTWSCPAINQDIESQAAEAKKAEEEKKKQEQEGLSKGQKEFMDMLTGQGYIIDPTLGQIASNRLKPVQLGTIPNLEKYFPKGLNVYYDPTKRSTSNVSAYKERASKMVADVNTCKEIIETYWDDYSGGGEGDLTDTQFLDTKNQAQACANKYYPKWNGLEGGVLGIGTGQNHLNDIIDVLTGRKKDYKGTGIPSRATGWLLTPPRTSR
jgi:hypothetical protein